MKIKNPIESDISLRAQFYLELIKHVIKTNILHPKTKFGDGDGLIVFLSTNICFDSAVFIYECIQYFEEHNEELYTEIFEHLTVESYERIKDVRNNMHLYNKKGSYQKKANQIIGDRIDEFEAWADENNDLTNDDISCMYYNDGKQSIFLGCSYFVYHFAQEYKGEDFKEFAENISGTLSCIVNFGISKVKLPSVQIRPLNFEISLSDEKSDDFLNKNGIDVSTNFRILLCLAVASWTYIQYFKVIDGDKLFDNSKSRWIVLKNLSIKYDEIFDSIENLLKYSQSKSKLNYIFADSQVDFDNASYREVIQAIRNTVHYNHDDLETGMDYYNSFKTRHNLTVSDFNKMFIYMKENLEALILTLQYFINV
ncbi:hypothetical protein Q5O24_13195 [Eubacteriaceae bacterium ES3]|nr:hypothetical protein Q5O24_13195 [Eubacteriaceae bacterium ES3]